MKSEEKNSEDYKQAKKFETQGYAIVSRKFCIAARVDRPDWIMHMAKHHAPWNPLGEGKLWVQQLELRGAVDHYRRCFSKDQITVSEQVRQYMPKSSECSTAYKDKESDSCFNYNKIEERILAHLMPEPGTEAYEKMINYMRADLDSKMAYSKLVEFVKKRFKDEGRDFYAEFEEWRKK